MKKCPVNHGPCTEDELVTKGCAIIKQFMERDPENMNFSMLVLAKTPQE
jgi:ubiquitin carboxyl-terminal hydrolase L3